MPLTIPPELKPINAFVRRAEELDKDSSRPESRLVAYYCRQYAVHTGIPLASTSSAAKTCLGHLLEVLEKDKPAMDNFTRAEAEYLCRQFAYQVFDKADGEDRIGMANKTTAKTFYTSSSFLQMLAQFYSQTEESQEHAREDKKRAFYAKWKATEILKAIKDGRTPQAGGYGEEQDGGPPTENSGDEEEGQVKKLDAPAPAPAVNLVIDVDAPEDEKTQQKPQPSFVQPPSDAVAPPPNMAEESVFQDDADEEEQEAALPPPPSYPGSPPPAPAAQMPPPPVSKPRPKPAPAPSNSHKPATRAQIADATELTRFALAALEDKNAELAATRLREALRALGQNSKSRGGGWFGGNKKRVSNAQLADALELVRFGMSSLLDHDAGSCAARLEQALDHLS